MEYKYLEKPIPKHIVEQIRSDAIEECIKIVKNTTRHFYIDEVITQMEQLKEQKE